MTNIGDFVHVTVRNEYGQVIFEKKMRISSIEQYVSHRNNVIASWSASEENNTDSVADSDADTNSAHISWNINRGNVDEIIANAGKTLEI